MAGWCVRYLKIYATFLTDGRSIFRRQFPIVPSPINCTRLTTPTIRNCVDCKGFVSGHPYLNHLHKLRYLVIDEADRMLEHGHFEELAKLLSVINAGGCARRKRQNYVFSATLTTIHQGPNRKSSKTSQAAPSKGVKLEKLTKAIGMREKPLVVDLTTVRTFSWFSLGAGFSITVRWRQQVTFFLADESHRREINWGEDLVRGWRKRLLSLLLYEVMYRKNFGELNVRLFSRIMPSACSLPALGVSALSELIVSLLLFAEVFRWFRVLVQTATSTIISQLFLNIG